ncbi:MAG: V-type ATP synthase subunit I [Sphaerochaetaceae bacterium]
MIVPMKRISIVMRTHEKTSALKKLRKMGVVHLDERKLQNEKIEDLASAQTSYRKINDLLLSYAKEQKKKIGNTGEVLDEKQFLTTHERLVWLSEQRNSHLQHMDELKRDIEFLTPFGEVSPEDLELLKRHSLELSVYKVATKSLKDIEQNYFRLFNEKKDTYIALTGDTLDESVVNTRISFPDRSLEQCRKLLAEDEDRIRTIDEEIAGDIAMVHSYRYYIGKNEQDQIFENVQSSMDESDSIVSWLSGYIPETALDSFRTFAKENNLAYALDDPKEDENPPTYVKNNKVVSIISPVFDILGTVPGYREYDISMWFLMFFAIFFAMIVGDGAYGAIFFSGAIALHLKSRKATNAVVLLYVLSTTSIIWGAITGTWFGSQEILTSVPFLKSLVIPNISSFPELFSMEATTAQNTVMKFCFIIGTVQLSLACVMNIHRKIGQKDLSAVADAGWLIMVDSLYFVVLMLVINETIQVQTVAALVGVGFVLVVLFGAQGPGISFLKGLAGGAANLFTTFLDSISTFSNIISYIRLFAVGMASLAIAQSFNNIASSMMSGFAIPVGILILLIGHGLNLVMALLSVVVHGVRLNLLEFSGQLGMEWTGYQYNPFRETVK